MKRLFPVLLMGIVVGACASGGKGTGTATAKAAPAGNYETLTADQLANLGNVSLLEAVQRLRPRWLSGRGWDSVNATRDVQVIMDGVKVGDTKILDTLRPTNVYLIRHYDGETAQGRWGPDCSRGAIYIATVASKANP